MVSINFTGDAAIHLLAQALNVDLHQVGARIEVVVPDLLANLDAGQHAARRAHQVFQQANSRGRQFDLGRRLA